MSETSAVYDATPWKGQLDKEYVVEVSPGRPIVCKQLSLVLELAAGKLPSELEAFTIFEEFDGSSYKIVKGQAQKKTDAELSLEQAERWSNYLRIAARSMLRPRLKIKGEPNYERGEIAPSDLSFAELREVAFIAIRKVVPPLETAPFPADAGMPDGERTGADLPIEQPVSQESV